MINNGYIKIHRKILDNPIVTKDNDYFRLWIHILLNANFNYSTASFKGNQIELKPGQLITGRLKLANETHINEQKVYRILMCFENEQLIEQQKSTKSTLISVKNWSAYQSIEQQNVANVNTIKEIKEIKENINIYGVHQNVQFSDSEIKALEEKYSIEFINKCIEKLSDYKHTSGKEYKSDYQAMNRWVINAVKKDDDLILQKGVSNEFTRSEQRKEYEDFSTY